MLNFWKRAGSAALGLAATFVALPCSASDGVPDPGFGSNGVAYIAHDDTEAREITPRTAIALPDGKLLIGGTRNTLIEGNPIYEPQVHGMLARLNADGSADSSFGNSSIAGLVLLPDLLPGTRMQVIESMQRLDDGSIIATGTAFVDSPLQGFVVKLDADGNLDATFGESGVVLLPGVYFHAVGIDSRQRIVVCGEHPQGQVFTSTVVRLLANGTFDDSFGKSGIVSIAWSGGENLSGYLNSLAITADDGVIVGGAFELAGPFDDYGFDYAIARLDAGGAFNPAFAGTGWRVFHDLADASTSNGINRLTLLADGRIAFAGYHAYGDNNRSGLVLGRVNGDGTTDATFGDVATPGFFKPAILADAETVTPTALVAQGDGKLVVAASYYLDPDKQLFFALRSTADGELDAGFADAGIFEADLAPGGVNNDLSAMTLQPDGRIVLAGRAIPGNDWSVADLAAVRLLNDVPPPDRVFANGFDG
jgi:uncharacterized delta-60 repeat protein